MNCDQMKGNWKQFIGKAKEKWDRLTNDDWRVVEGKRDQNVRSESSRRPTNGPDLILLRP